MMPPRMARMARIPRPPRPRLCVNDRIPYAASRSMGPHGHTSRGGRLPSEVTFVTSQGTCSQDPTMGSSDRGSTSEDAIVLDFVPLERPPVGRTQRGTGSGGSLTAIPSVLPLEAKPRRKSLAQRGRAPSSSGRARIMPTKVASKSQWGAIDDHFAAKLATTGRANEGLWGRAPSTNLQEAILHQQSKHLGRRPSQVSGRRRSLLSPTFMACSRGRVIFPSTKSSPTFLPVSSGWPA